MKQRYLNLLVVTCASLFGLIVMAGCDKDGDGGKSGSGKKSEADKPSLMMTHDSPACRQALKCCEAMVKLDKGKATPEDINLSCSGVALSDNDETCGEFKKGFAMAIESKGQTVPDECK